MSPPGRRRIRMRCGVCVLAALSWPAVLAAQDSSLVGLWQSKRWFGPVLRGELLVRDLGTGWVASLGGRTVSVGTNGDSISFTFPAGGTFTGRFAEDGSAVGGQWAQARTLNFRGYATPVVLRACGMGCFSGEVEPLEDTFTFYLDVRRRTDGTLGAFLRNPERNQGRFLGVDHLLPRGDTVELRNARDEIVETGLRRDETISVFLRGATHDFRRLSPDSFTEFYPRGERETTWSYAAPRRLPDGWEVAEPEDVGMTREPLERMVRAILAGVADSANAHRVHAIAVAREGKLVLEEYFFGESGTKPHDTRSASKTLVTVVLGAAMQAGMPVDPDTRVYEAMGTRSDSLDPRKRALTLRHLLTMSSGLDCDDNADEYHAGSEDYLTNQDTLPDWTRVVLGLDMLRAPGEQAVYCSINPYLAGQVIAAAAGRTFTDLAAQLVAEPLQMSSYYVNLDPLGAAYMGGGTRFVLRDFLKLAQLYANGGIWNERRILSEAWIDESLTPRFPMWIHRYGYLWWVLDYPYRGGTVRAYAALGNGGQFSMLIPELQLTIAGFGGNYAESAGGTTVGTFVPEFILPAVR